MLDGLARRYHCRPSDLIGGLSELEALSVDIYAAEAGVEEEKQARTRQKHSAMRMRGGRGGR